MSPEPSASIFQAATTLAQLWPRLLALPGPGAMGGAVEGSPSLPGGTLRMSLIHSVPPLIAEWSGYLARRNNHPTPVARGNTALQAGYLARGAQRLADTSVGDLAASELAEAAAQVVVLVDPPTARSVPIGHCPEEDCWGQVKAHTTDAGQWVGVLVCQGASRHTWHREDWPALALALGEAEAPALELSDLTRYLSHRFARPITSRHVKGWAAHQPLTFRRDAQGRYDRVQVTAWVMAKLADQAQGGR